jgi:hypothetical protein
VKLFPEHKVVLKLPGTRGVGLTVTVMVKVVEQELGVLAVTV